jgi:predicted nicotinamide N-methyase
MPAPPAPAPSAPAAPAIPAPAIPAPAATLAPPALPAALASPVPPASASPASPTTRAIVWQNTVLAAVPLVPEVVLHLSQDEPTVLWERTERETGLADLPPPFWAYPWAGGIALARYLLDHPHRVAGRVVLDLASGSGLVAIAAALAGARRVIASDIDPMAVAAIGLNAAANGVDVEVSGADLLTGEAAGPEAELVVVGDACYERRLAHRMLAFLRRARAGGATALIGDPGRAYLPRGGLLAVASYVVPAWPGLEDAEVKDASVWELSTPAAVIPAEVRPPGLPETGLRPAGPDLPG